MEEDDGVLWCRSAIPWPMFNAAIATPELGACASAGDVAAALAGGGLPWFMWVLAGHAGARGRGGRRAGASEFDNEAPWMEARIAGLDEPELPPA